MPANLIPDLSKFKSDFPDRPDAGTTADPIIVGDDIYPSSTWYPDVHALTTGADLTWPSANYYDSTGGASLFWTLIVNQELHLRNDISHTGAPDRSQPVNGTNYNLTHNSSQATMRVTQTWGDGADGDIPYFGINTLGSQSFSGNYGDRLVVSYNLGANFSNSSNGFQTYQFIVYTTNGAGTRKATACYLAPPAAEAFLGYTAPWDLDWDWRYQGSGYYPGAHFRFYFPSYYNPLRGAGITAIPTIDTSGVTYNLEFDLDDIIRVIYPEDASPTTVITGIELSMEQVWTAAAPGETLYTESIISNVISYINDTQVHIAPAPGSIVKVADYMDSYTVINDIIGIGENGYGVPVPWSGPVSTKTKIRSRDWNYLQRDLNSIFIHVTNTGTATTTVTNTTIVNSTLSNRVYDGVSEIEGQRYYCHPDQYFADPVTHETWNTTNGTSTRTLVWDMEATAEITHKVNAAWTTPLTARYFFNQGGYFIYKPFYANTGTTATIDIAWVGFINHVQNLGGFEYTRPYFVNPNISTVTKTWTSGTLRISLVAERNADKDQLLFTVTYKRRALELVPDRGYWNIIV